MIKYMTIAHHESVAHCIENGKVLGRVPVHNLMSNYYWTRLDAEHILLMGSHPLSSHNALNEHPDVVVLPFLHHRKTLKEHYKHKDKMGHHAALSKNLSLDEDATMQELVDAAIAKHGAVFAPKI